MCTVAKTQDGSPDFHRSVGASLLYSATAIAVTPRTNANRYNNGRRNNRCLDDLRDNADFEVHLSWMDRANVVNMPDTAVSVTYERLKIAPERSLEYSEKRAKQT